MNKTTSILLSLIIMIFVADLNAASNQYGNSTVPSLYDQGKAKIIFDAKMEEFQRIGYNAIQMDVALVSWLRDCQTSISILKSRWEQYRDSALRGQGQQKQIAEDLRVMQNMEALITQEIKRRNQTNSNLELLLSQLSERMSKVEQCLAELESKVH